MGFPSNIVLGCPCIQGTAIFSGLNFRRLQLCSCRRTTFSNKCLFTRKSMVCEFLVLIRRCTQISVGGSINNALCISKSAHQSSSSEAYLYVCNNDESIKIIEIPSMRKVGELKMPFAVNNVQISPEGNWLVAVGDSSQVLVYAIKTGQNALSSGLYYEKIAMVRGSESAFSCAWNHLSNTFAVGFQDGIVKVWDKRYIVKDDQRECMATIHATQKGKRTNEACRSVKFSPDSCVDLLAFSEHLSVVNLVDCRNWMDKQEIRMCPDANEASITGLSFGCGKDSKSLFVGLENGIVEYEIDLRKRKSFPSASLI